MFMGYLKLIFPAFLLICQLALPVSAAAKEIDPNELILQRLNSGEPSSMILKIDSEVEAPKQEVVAEVKKAVRAYPIVERESFERSVKDSNPEDIEPAAGSNKAITWFSSLSNGQRLTITFAKRPNVKIEKSDGEVVFRFSGRASYNPPLIPEKFSGSFQSIENMGGTNLTVKVKHKAGAERKVTYNSRRVFLDIIDDKPKEVEAKAEEPQEAKAEVKQEAGEGQTLVPNSSPAEEIAEVLAKPVEAAVVPEVVYTSYDKNIAVEKLGGVESFSFKFKRKTDAALFQRFGDYWLVFYSKEAFGLPNISQSELLNNVDRISHPQAVIYKFKTKSKAFASVLQSGNDWKVSFDPRLEKPLKHPLSLKKDGEEWFVNIPEVDSFIEVEDEFTNELLTVFPSRNAEQGFEDRVVFRDFIVEKSIVGIVLRKISEGSKLTFAGSQLRLTPSIQPQQLYAKEGAADDVKSDAESNPLIDFAKIKDISDDFDDSEDAGFLRKVSLDERGVYLFALGFYREAAVELGSKDGFENSFMSAAANFMAGRYEKTIADLQLIDIPEGKDRNEFQLWLVAAKQELLKQDPRAKVSIEIPASFGLPKNLANYPKNIATAVQIPFVEASINEGKIDYAESVLNNIDKTSEQRELDYVKLLSGEIKAAQGSNENAIEIWDELAKSTDSREVRAKAIYAKITKGLEIGKIKSEEALVELDQARILWRGGEIEFQILTKVAQLYAENKQYGEALLAYKTAISTIPFHPNSVEIAADMRRIYKLAMQKDFDDLKKSFEALTLYYDYIELKPTGREGEYMTIELAERLVGFDLIEPAIKVLEDFVVNVRDVEEKSLINTRIAILYYILRQPEKSLETLAELQMKGIPKYIQWQRKALSVRVLSERGEYDAALSSLTRIPAQKASELRAEIYWLKSDWKNFVDNYNSIQAPSPVNTMKAAVAYSMLGDDVSQRAFKAENAQKMSMTKYASAFNFITQSADIDYKNLTESVNLDFAKEVVKDYKEDLRLTDFFSKELAAAAVTN